MVNQPEKILDSWQSTGDTGPYQLFTAGYNNAAITAQSLYGNSDATIVDASYIRLKTIAISYDIPLKSKSMQCTFMLQGQNLLTFTKYTDGDPEFKSRGYLPPLKVMTAGMQLTF